MKKIRDYFAENIIASVYTYKNSSLVQSIYSTWHKLNWPTDTVFALNLQWPNKWCTLPSGRSLYVLTFHSEQVDVDWIRELAIKESNSTILVVSEFTIQKSPWWPENCVFASWVTWHYQVNEIRKMYGMATTPNTPERKISSLCFRSEQFKYYVTGYLLQKVSVDDMIISYYANEQNKWFFTQVGKPRLDAIFEYMNKTKPRILIDDFDASQNYPMLNCKWNIPPYNNAAINFTNEGFTQTYAFKDGHNFTWPGPYVTEKTWKPLLAGCAFVSVGQAFIHQELINRGFKFDYGFDLSHDREVGDLDRIELILDLIDNISSMSAKEISAATKQSTQHNLDWIEQGSFYQVCDNLNSQNLDKLAQILLDL